MPLDPRNEGVYVESVYVKRVQDAGPAGKVPLTSLTKIERVNGDCSVTTIILTSLELIHAMDEFRKLIEADQAAAEA